MTDDIVKQAATEDDDVYNDSLQTNSRLMVSPYSATLNYLHPQHQYQHCQQLQQLSGAQSSPAVDSRWLDVTTIIGISADQEACSTGYTVNCAGGDRRVLDDTGLVACTPARPPVCPTHMYESPQFQ